MRVIRALLRCMPCQVAESYVRITLQIYAVAVYSVSHEACIVGRSTVWWTYAQRFDVGQALVSHVPLAHLQHDLGQALVISFNQTDSRERPQTEIQLKSTPRFEGNRHGEVFSPADFAACGLASSSAY